LSIVNDIRKVWVVTTLSSGSDEDADYQYLSDVKVFSTEKKAHEYYIYQSRQWGAEVEMEEYEIDKID